MGGIMFASRKWDSNYLKKILIFQEFQGFLDVQKVFW